MNNSKFSSFDQALDDIDFCRGFFPKKHHFLLHLARAAILEGGRFYFPNSRNVLGDSHIDDDIKDLLRIPYDCTVVLSETFIAKDRTDREHGIPTYTITIAIEPGGKFAHRHEIFFNPVDNPERGYLLLSLLKQPRSDVLKGKALDDRLADRWMLTPAAVAMLIPRDRPGYELAPMPGAEPGFASQEGLKEFNADANTIMNLCMVLNLQNVKRETVSAPDKLNRSRVKSRKRPLLDYSILSVDGEVWDSPYTTEGEGPGKRSHMRRGHIRRLDEGTRRIWVRATYVRGSEPGFHRKDYSVEG